MNYNLEWKVHRLFWWWKKMLNSFKMSNILNICSVRTCCYIVSLKFTKTLKGICHYIYIQIRKYRFKSQAIRGIPWDERFSCWPWRSGNYEFYCSEKNFVNNHESLEDPEPGMNPQSCSPFEILNRGPR